MTGDGDGGPSRRRFLRTTGGLATAAALAGYAESVRADDGNRPKPSPRVRRLVEEMTVEEKVGQMTQVAAYEVTGAEDYADFFREYHVGSLLYATSSDPVELAETADEMQRAAVEETRLGIPFVYGIDAVHGNNNVERATIFPHNIGLGATWNPDLAAEIADVTGRVVRATGVHWTFSPVADLPRDPRWGRFYEGFTEDPYLDGEFVAAKVRGYERREGDHKRIGATVKHFAGYSVPRNGNDRAAALIPWRTFRSTILPPYAAGLDEGAETVMVNSGSVNGVPAHASEYLLTDLLRGDLGFGGMVVSDWHDFHRMLSVHGYAADHREAARIGINAGVDMYMVPAAGIEGDDVEAFTSNLVELVEEGAVPTERIDEAVTRILAFKENLGLFDDPYADREAIDEGVVTAGRDLAETAARESMTLLENDGTLPLSPDVGSVLVTGPSADSVANQMGGWTLGWQRVGDTLPPAVTVLDGVEAAVSSGTTVWHEPTGLDSFENEDRVRDRAERADVVLAVVGEGPYAEDQGDTDAIALPAAQRRLIETVAATGTPVVGVMIAGRPRGDAIFEDLSAALMAYLPGTAGGTAVADTLFGAHNPSGRLPFTWPHSTGQLLNVHNNYRPKEFDSGDGEGPPRSDQTPRFPFAHGESYTEFAYEDLRVAPDGVRPEHDRLTVLVRVTNVGDRAGTAIVPAFAGHVDAPVPHFRREVVGVGRVTLDPGESRVVRIEASALPLAIVPGDAFDRGAPEIQTGEYRLEVADRRTSFTVR